MLQNARLSRQRAILSNVFSSLLLTVAIIQVGPSLALLFQGLSANNASPSKVLAELWLKGSFFADRSTTFRMKG